MDNQTWASAVKQVKGTLGKWPILVLSPVALILPRYPEPWGSSMTLIFIGVCVGNSIRYALKARRILKWEAQAERNEMQYRLELVALTMEMQTVFERQMKAITEGKPGAAEEARQELGRIYDAQKRVMDKWKSSDKANTDDLH